MECVDVLESLHVFGSDFKIKWGTAMENQRILSWKGHRESLIPPCATLGVVSKSPWSSWSWDHSLGSLGSTDTTTLEGLEASAGIGK